MIEPKDSSQKVTVWLSYEESVDYPFPYKIGERLRSIMKNIDGIVHNAIYSGPADPVGGYFIVYHIVTDAGELYKIPLNDLERVTIH